MEEQKKVLSESKIELLPERVNDTKPLTEVALDNPNVIILDVERDNNGEPVFQPFD